ncbi:hypothetical protein EK21DRAFT_93089 [Setomelanomma holmii]|uniref:Uncharacterized protein n=1 Tax=Setomelanomma holmii TaxID=210430 RepID=A0A9P4LGG7_9PLEO|nr:hypothetical protein EK21DRAFT_93089 [Setomelanomma holmii]
MVTHRRLAVVATWSLALLANMIHAQSNLSSSLNASTSLFLWASSTRFWNNDQASKSGLSITSTNHSRIAYTSKSTEAGLQSTEMGKIGPTDALIAQDRHNATSDKTSDKTSTNSTVNSTVSIQVLNTSLNGGTKTRDAQVYSSQNGPSRSGHSSRLLMSPNITPLNASRLEIAQNSTFVHTSIKSSLQTMNASFSSSTSDRWATCPSTIYGTDFSVTMRTLPPECDVGASVDDMLADFFGNYDFIDRCLARWCQQAWYSAIGAYTSSITEITSYVITWMDVDFEPVYKSTLTASDEDSLDYFIWDYKWIYGTPSSTTAYYMAMANASYTADGKGRPIVPASYVDDTGFTFVSPSVYFAFTSLRATDSCGTIGTHPATHTMAFDPKEISTLYYSEYPYTARPSCPNGAVVWEKSATRRMTWPDLQSDCATVRPGISFNPDFGMNSMFNGLPKRIMEMHPEWASCTPYTAGGLWDPPITLHPGPMLVPTTAVVSTTISSPAVPRQSPSMLTVTEMQPSRTTLIAPSASSATRQEGIGPLIGIRFPLPVFVQPNQDPIIQEPGQPPRLNTITFPQPSTSNHESMVNLPVSVPKPPPIAFIVNGEAVIANSISRFVVGSQTLVPGGTISIGDTIVFFDVSASYVIINATSTIPIGRVVNTASGSQPVDAAPRVEVGIAFENISTVLPNGHSSVISAFTTTIPTFSAVAGTGVRTVVVGGTTYTMPDGQTTVSGGMTTLIPAGNAELRTLLLGGTTHTLSNGQVTVIGGITTLVPATPIASPYTTNMNLLIGDKTFHLPGGGLTIFGGSKTVVPAILTPGAVSVTVTFGGHTSTLSEGRVVVLGATTMVVPVPTASSEISRTGTTPAVVLYEKQSLSFEKRPTMRGPEQTGGTGGSAQATGNRLNDLGVLQRRRLDPGPDGMVYELRVIVGRVFFHGDRDFEADTLSHSTEQLKHSLFPSPVKPTQRSKSSV